MDRRSFADVVSGRGILYLMCEYFVDSSKFFLVHILLFNSYFQVSMYPSFQGQSQGQGQGRDLQTPN